METTIEGYRGYVYLLPFFREYVVKKLSRRSDESDVELPGSKTRILVKPDAKSKVP